MYVVLHCFYIYFFSLGGIVFDLRGFSCRPDKLSLMEPTTAWSGRVVGYCSHVADLDIALYCQLKYTTTTTSVSKYKMYC